VRDAIRPDTALIVINHASNVCGTIQPVAEVGAIAQERGIPLLVDAAQTAGCLPINVPSLCVDLLAFSGHKGLLGPQGTGGLYIRDGLSLQPLKQGGTGSASSEEAQPELMPDRYESGTPNTPGLAGLGAALEFLLQTGIPEAQRGMQQVGRTIIEGLAGLKGVTLYGPHDMERNVGVFSFRIEGQDPADTCLALEQRYGIMTRVGLHCSPAAHKTISTFPRGTVRASIGRFSTEADATRLTTAVRELCNG
jgi:selenocysteine lyase/cysteine desulfurase